MGLLVLHDIRDCEAFVASITNRSRRTLDHHQRERLHQFLLIALWKLSLTYRRGDPRFPSNFSGYAGDILPQRIIDWERSPEEGGRTRWQFADRTYERSRPVFSSLDDQQGEALELSTVDAERGGLTSVLGLDRTRDRAALRPADPVGEGPARRAA